LNGGIINNNRFAPYGEPLSPVAKNSGLTNSPWGYTGESHDIEAGLVYLRARYYELGTGRFIQQDSHWNPENTIYGYNLIIFNKQNTNIPGILNTNVYLPDIEAILQIQNLCVHALNNPLIYV
jgi:RHS repeat-associated protein